MTSFQATYIIYIYSSDPNQSSNSPTDNIFSAYTHIQRWLWQWWFWREECTTSMMIIIYKYQRNRQTQGLIQTKRQIRFPCKRLISPSFLHFCSMTNASVQWSNPSSTDTRTNALNHSHWYRLWEDILSISQVHGIDLQVSLKDTILSVFTKPPQLSPGFYIEKTHPYTWTYMNNLQPGWFL